MRGTRGGLVGLGVVAACALPGCHLDLGGRRDKPAGADAPLVAPVRATPFAELSRVPGSRIGRPGVAAPPTPVTAEVLSPAEDGVRPPPVGVTPPPASPPSAPADPPLVAAVRAYIEARPADAAGHLAGCDPASRDLLARLLPAAVRASQISVSAGRPADVGPLLEHVEVARNGLLPYAPLTVAKVDLAQQIVGFARYELLPDKYHYAPGATAEVYVELHNARPAPVGSDGAEWAVRVRWKVGLTDDRDQPVDLVDGAGKPAATRDDYTAPPTRGPVRHCHLALRVVVPRTPGVYRLAVQVEDANRPPGSFVSRGLTLRVGGGP